MQKTMINENDELISIKNIHTIADEFIRSGSLPSKQGLEWSVKSDIALMEDLPKFHAVVNDIIMKLPGN